MRLHLYLYHRQQSQNQFIVTGSISRKTMTKSKEVKPIAISSQLDDDRYNRESSYQKLKKSGADSRLIRKLYGKDEND